MALGKPFCSIDVSNNQLISFKNEGGFLVNDTISYGQGGTVYVKNNPFTRFPEFHKIGIPDLAVLGKLAEFGFDFTGTKWVCDSRMVPYLQLLEDLIRMVWRDYDDVKCHHPERLKGESIPKLVFDNRLDEFTSEISSKDGCPNFCTCIFYPVSNITNVKCDSSLMYMPKEMPDEGELDIDFSGTKIRQLANASYVGRIRKINLSGTNLASVPLNFLNDIERTMFSHIDLSKTNHLDRITTDFKILRHCNVHFGRKTIFCNCKSRWIQEWIDASSCQWNSTLTCRAREGLFPLSELSNALGCENENPLFKYLTISTSIVLLLLIVTLGTVYLYRYEIRILLKQNKDPDKIDWDKYKFDVYISSDKTNEQQILWILKIFLPDLRRSGYRVHFPLIDALPGSTVDEEVIGNMNRSRSFVIFLSNEYIADLDDFDSIDGIRTNLEWRHAWHFFRKSKEYRLIIINYGFNRICEVNRRELKAFLRVGKVLDFANKKHTLMTEVKELLGVPKIQFKGLTARKRVFNVKKEYLVTENIVDEEFELKV
ncbi:hypothetical protein FSP39_003968 [Pinctada imbricata]|uniref:TIR domain-containing protein n=1 Tax=Pinctada imbricata TaxID=66713 RepID=A0AA88XMC8_PINIB|nr:hypothetical protein FSP39_003968 [Pinctada imbricata]